MDDNTHKTRNCFLSCFGGVPRKSSFPNKESVKVVKEFKRSKKESRSLFWSKIKRMKLKNSSTRTVPIDHHHHHSTDLPNSDEISLNHKRRCHRKLLNPLSFHQITPTTVNTATDHQISKEIIEQTRPIPKRTIVLENRDSFDHHVDSLKGDTCDKRRNPFNRIRNIEAKRTGFSHPGSPDFKYGIATLTHSVSLPAPNRSSKTRVTTLKKSQLGESIKRSNNGVSSTVKKFDSVVGMSIITMTLIMMLFWGRLCAVLCTCTWVYFVSRLRVPGDRTVDNNPSSSDGGFLSSKSLRRGWFSRGFGEDDSRLAL